MWTILMAGVIVLLSTCNGGGQAIISVNKDTILLYEKDTMLIANITPAVLPIYFPANNTNAHYDSRLKTLLILEDLKLVIAPEGVYEIYITQQPPEYPSQTGFVTVLDLYSLTSPGAKKSVEVEISEPLKKLFLQKHTVHSAYLSIRFGAVKLPDGTYSSQAGELNITNVKIVQIN